MTNVIKKNQTMRIDCCAQEMDEDGGRERKKRGPLRRRRWTMNTPEMADCVRRNAMTSYLTLLVVICHIVNVTSLTMLTPGQIVVLNSGDTASLDCHFRADYYSLFENPLVWRKTQRHEDVILNTMGNVNEPFISTRRFQVIWTPSPPQYRLELTINDVKLEDSGNYTCEVRGPQSNILGHVTHNIYVRTPVEEIHLTSNNHTAHSPSLTFIEGQPSTLRCVTVGGFPTPELYVYVGGRDLTWDMTSQHSAKLSGVKGLRLMRFTTERRSDELYFTSEEDGKSMKCIVSIPGLVPNSTSVVVNVHYAPKITCHQTMARPGDRSVSLRCEVHAKPQAAALFWILGDNKTTITNSEVIGDYWTVVMDRPDGGLETYLYIKKAQPESFRVFSVVAENYIGTTTANAELVRLRTSSRKHEFTPETYMSVRGHPANKDKTEDVNEAYGESAVLISASQSNVRWTLSLLHICLLFATLLRL